MASDPTPNPAEGGRGYEERDVQPRAILWFFGGIAAMVLIAGLALWIGWQALQRASASRDPALSPLATGPVTPPPPRLQDSPRADYQAHRAREDQQLTTYGWVDRQGGIVRIPIDRAMELLVERREPQLPPLSPPPGPPPAQPR